MTSISTSNFGLVWHATPSAAISALDAALPNVGVATVLADANHPMPACDATETAALPISPVATRKHCWDDSDASISSWNPQGITSSGDADDDGAWGANEAILSGWQWTGDDSRHNDARVAFIDYNDPASPAYRWVYLVAPNSTGTTFSAGEAYTSGVANAQGVLSYNGRWYVAHSSATYNGQLWRVTPNVAGVSKTCASANPSPYMCWAMHPEALTYDYATGLVWSQSEWPNQRAVFAVPLSGRP
jgi:hypothetical protein